MHSGLTCVALVPASVGFPLVFALLPWLFALVDEGLLSLLCLVRNGPAWFGVQVVLLVFIDFGQSLCGMFVNFVVVLVEYVLPGLFVGIVDLGCPLPSCQGRIPLALA